MNEEGPDKPVPEPGKNFRPKFVMTFEVFGRKSPQVTVFRANPTSCMVVALRERERALCK
jgi:hypothetical protein